MGHLKEYPWAWLTQLLASKRLHSALSPLVNWGGQRDSNPWVTRRKPGAYRRTLVLIGLLYSERSKRSPRSSFCWPGTCRRCRSSCHASSLPAAIQTLRCEVQAMLPGVTPKDHGGVVRNLKTRTVTGQTNSSLRHLRAQKNRQSSLIERFKMVASLGIEPRTQGFSVLCSTN